MDSAKLELVPTCSARIEEMEPAEQPIACPECGQPVTPGQQHPVEVDD